MFLVFFLLCCVLYALVNYDDFKFDFSEYYFSTDNLQRDFFLRRKMTPEGYLPLALIASFNRVQQLTQVGCLIPFIIICLFFPCCKISFPAFKVTSRSDSQCCGSGSAWIRIIFGNCIRICIRVKSFIRIRIEVKIQ
jgi:hypothetical protein